MEQEHPDIYEHGLPDEMREKYDAYLQPYLLPWDGVWPGVKECREYGLWCKWTSTGWQTCTGDDPDAKEDLNELATHATWNREKKRFIWRVEGRGKEQSSNFQE